MCGDKGFFHRHAKFNKNRVISLVLALHSLNTHTHTPIWHTFYLTTFFLHYAPNTNISTESSKYNLCTIKIFSPPFPIGFKVKKNTPVTDKICIIHKLLNNLISQQVYVMCSQPLERRLLAFTNVDIEWVSETTLPPWRPDALSWLRRFRNPVTYGYIIYERIFQIDWI